MSLESDLDQINELNFVPERGGGGGLLCIENPLPHHLLTFLKKQYEA